jgi:hypothetical protein
MRSRWRTGGLMALARLWEDWRSPSGEWIHSFGIITTKPNELCAELHDRVPVVSAPETWAVWLGEEPADPRQLKGLLGPYPSDRMICSPVSMRVGNSRTTTRARSGQSLWPNHASDYGRRDDAIPSGRSAGLGSGRPLRGNSRQTAITSHQPPRAADNSRSRIGTTATPLLAES